jgi:hypothetical protein
MESWTKAELNYVRVLRHPCLVSDLQTRDVSAWTRANNGVTILAVVPTVVLARITS